jgi:hypothetical protein
MSSKRIGVCDVTSYVTSTMSSLKQSPEPNHSPTIMLDKINSKNLLESQVVQPMELQS